MEEQPRQNKIVTFFHCDNCAVDKPSETSPREWGRLEIGWTPKGIQVWCTRCEMNVVAYDFQGMKVAYDDLLDA